MRTLLCFLFAASSLISLEEAPWYPPFLEFQAKAAVDPYFFDTVKNGFNPISYHSHNVRALLGLGATILPTLHTEVEVTLQRSSRYSFGFESTALGVRMLFLDDLSGDPVSLDAGINMRFVAAQRLHDVATPYHNLSNFELTSSVGKEWSRCTQWISRMYLFGGVGQATQGYPWIRFAFHADIKPILQASINALLLGYFGFGPHKGVNVSDFHSYASIHHQNVDFGVGFTYYFKVWGEFSFLYSQRVFARSFPDEYYSFMLKYVLPFSL